MPTAIDNKELILTLLEGAHLAIKNAEDKSFKGIKIEELVKFLAERIKKIKGLIPSTETVATKLIQQLNNKIMFAVLDHDDPKVEQALDEAHKLILILMKTQTHPHLNDQIKSQTQKLTVAANLLELESIKTRLIGTVLEEASYIIDDNLLDSFTADVHASSPDTFKPTAKMADNARRALEVRDAKPPSQRGMTLVGLARANQLIKRENLSLNTVRRMKAYFDRHASDKQGSTWSEKGKGWQAWMGWGGDEGWAWAKEILKSRASSSNK